MNGKGAYGSASWGRVLRIEGKKKEGKHRDFGAKERSSQPTTRDPFGSVRCSCSKKRFQQITERRKTPQKAPYARNRGKKKMKKKKGVGGLRQSRSRSKRNRVREQISGAPLHKSKKG